MSFFGSSQRSNVFIPKQNPSPAQYQIFKQSRKSHGYAPFNSTVKYSRGKKQSDRKNAQNQINQQDRNAAFNQQMIDQQKLRSLVEAQMAKPNQSSMFTSRSQRFIKNHKLMQEIPGPGSYNLRGNILNKKHPSNKKKERLNQSSKSKIFKDNARRTNPSFPNDNLGYKQLANSELQKIIAKKSDGAYPGAYQIRKDLLISHGVKWRPQQQKIKSNQNMEPGPGSYTNGLLSNGFSSKKKSLSSLTSKADRFGVIKSIRNHVNPGPGSYLLHQQSKVNKSVSQGHFNSKCPRFQDSNKYNKVPDPGQYFADKKTLQIKLKNKKSKSCFNSSQKKTSIFQQQAVKKTKMPGPGEYVNIYQMKHKLQMSMIRKYNNSQFPNQKRQVFQNKTDFQQPGPGQYNPQKPNLKVKGAINYKPIQIINLKEQQEIIGTPAPFDTTYNNFTIAQKSNQSINRLTLIQRKPFDSGIDRFKHYSQSKNDYQMSVSMGNSNMKQKYLNKNPSQGNIITHKNYDKSIATQETDKNYQQIPIELNEMNRKVKKLVMTTVKVKVPFGISSSKYQQAHTVQPGPGFYQNKTPWIKNTFNIKGKIAK